MNYKLLPQIPPWEKNKGNDRYNKWTDRRSPQRCNSLNTVTLKLSNKYECINEFITGKMMTD